MEFCEKHEPHIGIDHWQINIMACDNGFCIMRVWLGVSAVHTSIHRMHLAVDTTIGRMAAHQRPIASPLTNGMHLV